MDLCTTSCRRLTTCAVAAIIAWLSSDHNANAADPPKAKPADAVEIECRRAAQPIRLDGKADEPAWKDAQLVENFTPHWAGRKARTATKARLLWDDDYLYFFADMQDADLYADVKEHDGQTWSNDVFELFFKPAEAKLAYYEFQVTPANTTMDMFLPSRGSGGFQRWAKANPFKWQTQVGLQGTLNDAGDKDQGWSAEGRFPWSDFKLTGGRPKPGDVWRCALCRYDYSVEFEEMELSSTAPLSRVDFHHYEEYNPLRFIGPKQKSR